MTGWQLQLAVIEGKHHQMGRYVVLQQQYNLLSREVEFEVTKVAEREGIAYMPWSPLKGGWLTGKMNRETGSAPAGSRVATQTKDGVKNEAGPNWNDLASKDKTWNILDKLREIGKSNKKTVSQVAVRYKWKFQWILAAASQLLTLCNPCIYINRVQMVYIFIFSH